MSIASGWYPDPADAQRVRWWDGSRWTEHTQPIESAPTPPYVPFAGVEHSRNRDPQATATGRKGRVERDREIRRNNGFAYTGLVLALVSLIVNPFAVLSVLAIIFSSIGIARAGALEGRSAVTGRGTAIAGLVIGIATLAFLGWKLSQALSTI